MNNALLFRKAFLITAAMLVLLASGNGIAAEKYRVNAQFFHLGELIGKPMLEVEEGVTAAGSWTPQGWGQYTVAAQVRPVADGQVYVSMQFSSGNINLQPNLLIDIGKPASVIVDKVRMELLVEKIGDEKATGPDHPVQLTQNAGGVYTQ